MKSILCEDSFAATVKVGGFKERPEVIKIMEKTCSDGILNLLG